MEASELLLEAFGHRRDAYATQYQKKNDEGVLYRCTRQALTKDILDHHVGGSVCLGAYNVSNAGTCGWACIDLDCEEYPERALHVARMVAERARHFGLRPLVESSGRKGYHVWLLCEPTAATLLQRAARGIVSEVPEEEREGVSIEVFPKQAVAADTGNLVKLPWGKRADNGARGLFVDPDTGEPFDGRGQLEALERAVALRHTAAELEEVADANDWNDADRSRFNGKGAVDGADRPLPGLPCYVRIETGESDPITKGARNKVLYAMAKQLQRRHFSAAEGQSVLERHNTRFRPPLDAGEVQAVVASAFGSKKQGCGCEILQPLGLCPALTGTYCPVYASQQKEADETRELILESDDALTIHPLRVTRMHPPLYTATVRGCSVRLTLAELMNFARFKSRCVEEVDDIPSLPVKKDKEGKRLASQVVWEIIVKDALKGLIEEDSPPEDASEAGALWDEVRSFFYNRKVIEDAEKWNQDAIMRRGGDLVFRGATLRKHLKLNGTVVPEGGRSPLWIIMRDHGGSPDWLDVKSKRIRVWRIAEASIHDDQFHFSADKSPKSDEATEQPRESPPHAIG